MRSGKFCSNPVLLLCVAAVVFLAGSARGQDTNPLNPTGAGNPLGGGDQSSSSSTSGDTGDVSGRMQGGQGGQQTSVPRGVNLPNGQDINASGVNVYGNSA